MLGYWHNLAASFEQCCEGWEPTCTGIDTDPDTDFDTDPDTDFDFDFGIYVCGQLECQTSLLHTVHFAVTKKNRPLPVTDRGRICLRVPFGGLLHTGHEVSRDA